DDIELKHDLRIKTLQDSVPRRGVKNLAPETSKGMHWLHGMELLLRNSLRAMLMGSAGATADGLHRILSQPVEAPVSRKWAPEGKIV
ncbi:hypothetical protein HAX54_020710, partial [Datura stramonium]|nr:hypothetical protein [Datura stramonium]